MGGTGSAMDQLEVMPVSSRVVCLTAPHLKSLCVFEALSRTLGCYYNHHRPQIVSCYGKVRLPVPRITRIRGHTGHTHTPGEAPTLHTLLQMGTYLVFHLSDWTQVQHCHLVLNGIEKVPRTDVPAKVILERIDSTTTASRLLPPEGESEPHLGAAECVTPDPPLNNSNNRVNSRHTTLSSVSERVSCAIKSLGLEQRHTSHEHSKNISSKTKLIDNQGETKKSECEKWQMASSTHMTINMEESEEVTTLLDDDYSSDTSDDLHKVVRRRLVVDITPLLQAPPSDNILTILLRPAEETQAWQFLSSCIKVIMSGSKDQAVNGSGTMKRALMRTRPLYFSKNGNAHRL